MPIDDWADPRDVAYRRYKKKLIKKPARAYMAYGESDMPADACDGQEMASGP